MISIDTNILFAASHSAAPFHDAAAGFQVSSLLATSQSASRLASYVMLLHISSSVLVSVESFEIEVWSRS